jgi:hypothetical protein
MHRDRGPKSRKHPKTYGSLFFSSPATPQS